MSLPEGGSGRGLAPIDDRRSEDRGDGSNRRAKPRRRVLLAAILETPEGELPVKLRNLSSTGALIETDRSFQVGSLVTLRRGNTVAPGTVRWTKPGNIGVEFMRPIHETEVLIHIGPSTRRFD